MRLGSDDARELIHALELVESKVRGRKRELLGDLHDLLERGHRNKSGLHIWAAPVKPYEKGKT